MARWHSCNVLQVGAESRHVWQFDARNGKFPLNREQTTPAGEPLPLKTVGKTWVSLWQRKLNVAWLPPEDVFVRVAQFPKSTPEETRAMVELQLEKLSPIPVTQAVWTMQVVPHAAGNMQTVIVVIVARTVVETFLGKLESQGYLADRLELPLLDQLQATEIHGDGAWIYPEAQGGKNTALVAWHYGGILQNVDLLTLPEVAATSASPGQRGHSLRDQLMQMAWAGELEGWLTSPPRWHLVADDGLAAEWLPALREGLDQNIEVSPPLPPLELASRTAKRAAQSDLQTNLMPDEFALRYQQQFVDRLWMRALGATLMVYLIGVAIYFVATGVLRYQTNNVEAQAETLGPTYTNAIHLRAQAQILKERQELKYAALDCWESVAELLPENVTLDSLNFNDGQHMTISGTAPSDEIQNLIEFSGKLRKAEVRGQRLFSDKGGDQIQTRANAGGTITWSFSLDLKQAEKE